MYDTSEASLLNFAPPPEESHLGTELQVRRECQGVCCWRSRIRKKRERGRSHYRGGGCIGEVKGREKGVRSEEKKVKRSTSRGKGREKGVRKGEKDEKEKEGQGEKGEKEEKEYESKKRKRKRSSNRGQIQKKEQEEETEEEDEGEREDYDEK